MKLTRPPGRPILTPWLPLLPSGAVLADGRGEAVPRAAEPPAPPRQRRLPGVPLRVLGLGHRAHVPRALAPPRVRHAGPGRHRHGRALHAHLPRGGLRDRPRGRRGRHPLRGVRPGPCLPCPLSFLPSRGALFDDAPHTVLRRGPNRWHSSQGLLTYPIPPLAGSRHTLRCSSSFPPSLPPSLPLSLSPCLSPPPPPPNHPP